MAYDRLFPLDMQTRLMAQVLTLLANVHRDEKKHRQPYRVTDFLPNPFLRRLTPGEEQRVVADARAELQRGYMKRKVARSDA